MTKVKENRNILYQEQSQRSMSAGTIIFVFIAILIAALGYVTYLCVSHGKILLAEYFIIFFALAVFIRQAAGTYTLILTDKELIIQEKTFFWKSETVLPYDIIDGVYAFRQEFMGQLKYRYKFRKLSSLDPRKVWALAYGVPDGKKMRHARMLIKAEQAFFDKLKEFIPDRIQAPQEEVVFYALLREDAHRHGENVEDYLAQVKAQQAAAEKEEAQAEK